jgi:cytochrome b561
MANKYTRSFVTIHWIHAVLIAFLIIGATLSMPDLPKDGSGLAPFKMHIILGVLATLLAVIRLIMLRSQPKLEPLKFGPSKEQLVKWNHRLIYLFILLTGISGFATAQSAHIGQILFLGQPISTYTGPGGLTATLGSIHSFMAYTLAALVAMHVAGVIIYTIQTKEKVLARMGFGK